MIEKRRKFRRLLPASGGGSRGGIPDEIVFKNGAHLKFMGAGAGDAARSSYTARVLVATEIDKMDQPGEASRETSPVRQMERRLASYEEDERRIYLECTVSIEEGAIWQETQVHGTASKIVVPCPYCHQWSTPEREHLQGWQHAETVDEAKREACWVCPHCGAIWDDDQRREMNQGAKLIHRGQTIDEDGTIRGEPDPTDTLGFRFNAFNNLFWRTSTIAGDEWRAARSAEEDLAEREMRQFVWVIPHKPPTLDLIPLDPVKLRRRVDRGLPRGLLPADTEYLTIGLDVGKWVGWWYAIAWRPGPRAHVPDYGTIEIPSRDMLVEQAIEAALREFRDQIEGTGFLLPDGRVRIPDQVWIDARYQGPKMDGGQQPEAVYSFIRQAGNRYRPCLGLGTARRYGGQYHEPKQVAGNVVHIGEQYHIQWLPEHRVFAVKVNADHWKSTLHEQLGLPLEAGQERPPGSMTFYESPDANEHLSLVKQLTSEKPIEEIVPGFGAVKKWVHVRGKNHWLDAGYLATAAGHLCGVRFVKPPPRPAASPAPERPLPRLGPGWRPELPLRRRS